MYFKRPMCVLCLCFVFLFWLFFRFFPPGEAEERFSDGIASEKVTVYGRLYKLEYRNYSTILYLKDIKVWPAEETEPVGGRGKGLLAYLADPEKEPLLRIGCEVVLDGEYSRFDEAQNTGNFDARGYYAIRRIYGRVKKARILRTSGKYSWIGDALFRLKEKTKEVFFYYLGETEGGTLSALILGDKTDLDAEVREGYQNAGIAHILSLSGLHIAALGLLLLKLFRKSGLPLFAASFIAGSLMLLYSIMTGLSTSTVRALVMYLLAVLGQCLRRTYDLLSGAALSAILILWENPGYIFDSGFLLSFSAVMGISILHPVLSGIFQAVTERFLPFSLHNSNNPGILLVKKLLQALLFSVSIQLSTLPVVQYSFYQIPVYGMLLNLVVIPLMSGLLGAGVLLSITGDLAMFASGTEILHTIFNAEALLTSKIAYVILKLYSLLTEGVNRLSGNLWICGKPSGGQMLIYSLILLLLTASYSICEKKKREAQMPETPEGSGKAERCFRRCCLLCFPGFILAVLLLSVRARAPLELHAISVGQGDCMLIFGKDTPVILIDGGATDVKNTGKYRILPCLKAYGISEVDYVCISHFDADHVNGINELLSDEENGITVRRILISAAVPYLEENENFQALKEAAANNRRAGKEGIPVMLMDAGDIVADREIMLTCLGPDVSGSDRWRSRDLNDNSLILHLSYRKNGFTALFTGDMSQETERGLLEDYKKGASYLEPLSAPVTLLKAAHHGSRSASSPEFIRLVSPTLTTISCGMDNSYGHPHREAVETLGSIGGNRIYLTPRDGEITIRVGRDTISVETFAGKSH